MVKLDLAGEIHKLKLTWSGLRPFSRCFVRDLRDVKYRRFSLKMLLKLASKCWDDDLTKYAGVLLSCVWPKMVLVLHLLRSFLKYFVWTSPGAFDGFKVDLLIMFTSPGAFEILCQGFFLNWLTPLKLTLKKCRISSQILQKFSSFLKWLKLFSLSFGIVVVVFIEDDAKVS
jgi:hypothetical protein